MKTIAAQSRPDSQNHELCQLLSELPEGTVWRDLIDTEGTLLYRGAGEPRDGIDSVVHQINFRGKGILDLGCNTGHNTFLALQHEANHVFGVDSNPHLIRCARLLATMYGETAANFLEANYNDVTKIVDTMKEKQFPIDMTMLVNGIGKNLLREGQLDVVLKSLKKYGSREIVLTVRPIYRLQKHFNMTEEQFQTVCPTSRVQRGRYHCALDIADKMGPQWVWTSPVTEADYDECSPRILLIFHRK